MRKGQAGVSACEGRIEVHGGREEMLGALASTAILSCVRQDPNRRSYVKLVRGDTGSGEESLTIPSLPYDKDGFAVDSLAVLMDRVATLEARASEQDRKFAQLAFETDIIVLRAVGTRPLPDPSGCPTGAENLRGELKGRVNFSNPFATAPEVTVGLSEIHLRGGDSVDMNRLRISITSIDERGFDYSFVTWCRTVVQSATASWFAIAK